MKLTKMRMKKEIFFVIYTRLKKRPVKSRNDGQCDTMELWEDDNLKN